MERFFTYCKHWITLEQAARTYLFDHSQVRSYTAGMDFALAGEARPFWCFVLSGLVAGVEHLPTGRQIYNWLARPGDYFTGTAHLFTPRAQVSSIHFLRKSEVLVIPLTAMQYAQQHFLTVSESLHVLKQHRMLHQEELLLLDLMSTNDRYAYFRIHMADVYNLLDEKEQIPFLRMGRSQFYAAKAAWEAQQHTK